MAIKNFTIGERENQRLHKKQEYSDKKEQIVAQYWKTKHGTIGQLTYWFILGTVATCIFTFAVLSVAKIAISL